MSNNWSQPPAGNQPGENNTRAPQTGGLLQNYKQQQQQPDQQVKQFSPVNMPSWGGLEPLPNGPFPPGQGPASMPGRVPTQGLLSAARKQGLLGNAMQMVRQVSGKVATVNRQQMVAPAPDPLVRYHPTDPVMSGPLPKVKPWRRSSSVRVAMRMRRRRVRLGSTGQRVGVGILIALIALLVISSSSGTAYGYAYYQSQQPQLQGIASKQISQVSHIYDRNGVFITDVFNSDQGRRTSVSYDQVPQVMQDAMVAAEDPTFWTNGGIDPQGLLRAIIYGGSHGGGSTLTQQLIKNMKANGNDTSVQRKLSEGALAIGMTQQYPKKKILEMYLNVAPFGATELGVESASEDYFGLARKCDKNFNCTPAVSQLDYNPKTKTHSGLLALARASFLAAMPNNPSQFDPGVWALDATYKNMALGRQIYILQHMQDAGMLEPGLGANGAPGLVTPQIMTQVEQMTQNMTFGRYKVNNAKDYYFVDWVKLQLELALGNGDANAGAALLENGGFNIRTTLDINLESYVEAAVKRHITQPEYQKFKYYVATLNDPAFNVNDAAVVVMNAKTGEVLALDGSADYNSSKPEISGQYNMAAFNARQPGSTFKPIVYATAFEMGWYPGMVVPDVGTYFPNGATPGMTVPTNLNTADPIYAPHDYAHSSNSIATVANNLKNTSIRTATASSYNVPAVRALAYAGVSNVVTTAQRMGITGLSCQKGSTNCSQLTSLALGTKEVTLLQMVNAYQTFADNGRHVAAQGILDIWDNYGHSLYHFDPTHVQSAQILSPQVSYMMTSVLDDEAARKDEFFNDHDLSFWDWDNCTSYYVPCNGPHQVAAKTGTTDSFKDNWTIGYTPDVVTGVWVGNADDTSFGQQVIGITGAAPIWHSVMERVSGRPCADLTAQDQVPCGNINLNGLGLGTQGLFTQPSGLHQQCVNNINGLLGTGGSCDWMLDGQDPQQAGILQALPTTNGGNGKKK